MRFPHEHRLPVAQGPEISAIFVILAFLLLAAGCDSGETVPPLPDVDLASFEPLVREQVGAALESLRDAPRDASRNGELAKLLDAYGRFEQAALCYERAAALAPRESSWPCRLAELALRRGERAEAIRRLERAIACEPESSVLLTRLGEVLLETGDFPRAREQFEAACRLAPSSVRAWIGRGDVALREGDLVSARGDFEKALEIDPDRRATHYRLATLLTRLGEEAAAAEHFARFEKLAGRAPPQDELERELEELRIDSDHLLRRANSLLKAEKFEEAAALYRRVVAQNSELVMAWYNLGLALQRQGRYDEAIPCYRTFLKVRASSPDALNNLGLCHLSAGELDAAAQRFREAAAADPSYWKAHFNEGLVHARRGARQEAIEAFGRVLETHPTDVDTHFNLAVIHRAEGNRAPYREHALTALRLDPDEERVARLLLEEFGKPEDGVAHRRLAAFLAKEGLRRAERAVLRRRCEGHQEDFRSCLALAWILATSASASDADAQEAVRLAESTAGAAPDSDAVAYDILAAAYAAAGRFDDALRAIDEALRRAAAASGGDDVVRGLRARRALYLDRRAYRVES